MLIEALRRQFDKAFDILAATISSFDQKQWQSGSPPFDGPGRAVAHVLLCAEFYTCKDQSLWESLGKPIHEMSDHEVPPQRQMMQYCGEVRSKTLAWIDSVGAHDLAVSPDKDGAAQGVELVIYALRHLQHHTGEICAYQKQHGLEPAPWR